jgi:hypothetical protein
MASTGGGQEFGDLSVNAINNAATDSVMSSAADEQGSSDLAFGSSPGISRRLLVCRQQNRES